MKKKINRKQKLLTINIFIKTKDYKKTLKIIMRIKKNEKMEEI